MPGRPKLQNKPSLCDLGWLMEKRAYQKSLQFTKGFAGTFMDGNDGEEKERKKHL